MSTEALEQSDMGQAQFHLFTDEQEQLRKEIREFPPAKLLPMSCRGMRPTNFLSIS